MHSAPFSQHEVANYYFTCFCRIAVPFFFVVSSYFFYKKGNDIFSFIKRLLVLYAVWFLIESPITIYNFFIASDKPLKAQILIFLRGLFVNSTFPGSWFITALWEGMLIVWLLAKKLNWRWMIIIGILCILASLPGTLYYGLIRDTPFRQKYWLFNMVFCPANSFITAIPYCLAGKYLATKERFPSSHILWAFLIAVFFLGVVETTLCKPLHYISDTYVSLYLFTPLLVSLLLSSRIHLSDKKALYLRKTSILIYFIHLPILFILQHFFHLEKGPASWLVTLFSAILFSTVIYFLSRKIPLLKHLY